MSDVQTAWTRDTTAITFIPSVLPQPAYLRSSWHVCHSTRSLRLSNTNLLSASFVRTSFGARSFSVAAPKTRNSLPPSPCIIIVPVLIPSVVTSRPTIASRPSNPVLAPQIRFLLTIVCVYKLYLLTYLLSDKVTTTSLSSGVETRKPKRVPGHHDSRAPMEDTNMHKVDSLGLASHLIFKLET